MQQNKHNKPRSFTHHAPEHIVYDLYNEADFEGVKEVLYKSFYQHEPMCRATEFHLPASEQARAELTELCAHALLDGVSCVARDVRTNQIVGHAINKIQMLAAPDELNYFDNFKRTRCHSANGRAFMDFMVTIDGTVDLFALHGVECLFEVMFLGTLPGYERQGIGHSLFEYSIELAAQLKRGQRTDLLSAEIRLDGRLPQIVLGVCSSPTSRRICENFGLIVRAELDYETASFDGRTFAERIDNEQIKSVALMSREL